MCIIKRRANSPEQKAERCAQILAAARQRFSAVSYEEVNLNHIAKDVGITKAALYRYFRNKETLFLALFVETAEELLLSAEQITVQGSLAAILTQAMLANPLYCKLSAILHTILERNLSDDEALQFKRTLLSLMQRYAQVLARISDFTEAQTVALLLQVQQALIGCWHMTHPTGAVARVIESAELRVFKQDFGDALFAHIERLVQTYV